MRLASVRYVRSGTRATSSACTQVPVVCAREPSGITIALTPEVDATTTARSNSTARIRAMSSCCSVSPVWPSTSKVASLVCTASRFAPALTSDWTRSSKLTS